MLTVDDYGRIRRAHCEGQSLRAIARTMGHSRRTIRKALARAEPAPYALSAPRPTPVLDPVRAVIDQILADDEHAPRKQRHTAMQIHRRLTAEHGYTGSYATVRRYVAGRRDDARETCPPLDHPPGLRLECDFGHFHIDLPEGRCNVPFLVCAWGYSNAPFALAVPTERVEAILAGMVAAFDFFDCVPREVWWDNPKTIATAILTGRERRFHDRWLALASYYCFEPRACMPARPQEKPRAEGRVKDVQKRFATPVPEVADLAELNQQLREWCLTDRKRTIQGHEGSIGERFAAEQAAALPLPPAPLEPVVYKPAVVSQYQQVRYDNVFYSVPRCAAFRTVTLKASIEHIEVLLNHQSIARHRRCYEPYAQVMDPYHYLGSLERRPADLDFARVYREWQLPAAFAQLREGLEQRHGPVAGRRRFVGVLALLQDHALETVTAAVQQALARGNFDTGALRLEVERRSLRQQPLPAEPALPPVEVPAPDLQAYDQLLKRQGADHV